MRKKLILKVASEKFAEKGYHASLTEIAKGSGMRKQMLYNYYENKEDLFLMSLVWKWKPILMPNGWNLVHTQIWMPRRDLKIYFFL